MEDDEDEDRQGDRGVRRADEVLGLLVERLRAGTGGARLRRLAAAESALRRCLEVNAPRLLTTLELELLVLEQHFDPEGATARVASAEVLLPVLPIFLDEPRWHGRDPEDRRLRVRFAQAITRGLLQQPELRGVDVGCAVLDVACAVDRARAALRTERRSGAEA